VLQEPVEIDVLHPDDILPSPPPPTDVKPEIGFFFDPSIGVPIGDRKAVKRAVLEKFEEIDTGHVARDRWKNDLQREDIDSDGHIEESVIKDTLTTEVAQLDGSFTVGAQVQWCYAVRGSTIICFHCYVLINNGQAVTVTKRSNTVTLEIYYAWELPEEEQ